jgi:diguanylate cyclase (GGDEF)-like protein/PAS domain S-box-containing protein
MYQLRLRTSLILLIFISLTMTFVVTGAVILLYRLPQIEIDKRAELQERAENISRFLDRYTDGIETQIKSLAKLVGTRPNHEQQAYLDVMVGEGEVFEAAYLVSAFGTVQMLGLPGKSRQASTDLLGADFSGNPLFRQVHAPFDNLSPATAIWSDKYLSVLSGTNAIGIALPVADKILIFETSLKNILQTVSRDMASSDATVVVADGRGQWLASSRSNPEERLFDYAGLPTFQALIAGTALPGYETFNGQRLIVGGILSNKLGWVIGAVAAAGMANHDYRMTVMLVVGGFLCALLLSSALAFFWSWGITRSVNDLTGRTRRLIEGDYESPWPRRGTIVELTQLSGDFGHMIAVIRSREADMARSEERLRATLEGTPIVAVQWFDIEGRVLYWNRASQNMYGFSATEAVGSVITENQLMFLDRSHTVRFLEVLQEIARSGKSFGPVETSLQKKDASLVVVLTSTFVIPAEDGSKIFVSMDVDVTERKHAEDNLRIAATTFESQEGIVVTDAQRVILRVNRALTENTGYTALEMIGQTPSMFNSGCHSADFYRRMWQRIDVTGMWQGEIRNRHKDGSVHPKWLTVSAVKNDAGEVTHYVENQIDITERKNAEEKIQHLAFYDQLTGLPNKTLLLDRLKQAMAANLRGDRHGALLMIDLDNFKTLNDTLGHDVGDLLLQQAAQRLLICVREDDTVARIGGDEFVVMLTGLGGSQEDAANGAEAVTKKVLAMLAQPYLLANVKQRSTASIGVTLFKGNFASRDDLIKQVDLAMYRSKDAGRNTWRFFDPLMETALKDRSALENDLRRGLDEQQFVLHYQAQMEGDNRLAGVEALVRWQHPQRGMVSPAEFIPLAEETGLILPLGLWVLETACTQLTRWASRPGMAYLMMAVNVSASQFQQSDFVAQVLAVLERSGANPQRLKLELTESLLVSDLEEVVAKMVALKNIGVGFALDDFGTGYSSLSYLKRLPLDQLKIDQSFVRDVLTDDNDAVIAKAVIALANSLGLGVIAEGVETEAQRTFLADSGCHAYQGYLFSRPLAIDAFEKFAIGF